MGSQNNPYAAAYARKILITKNQKPKTLGGIKSSKHRVKPINKHGNYEGTDVGFTSNSIEKPVRKKTAQKKRKKPIDRHGNYDGTDVGFTANFEE